MGFLAQLLPGVREIRTPLVAGVVWMVSVWLIWSPGEDALPAGIETLLDAGGRATVIAVLSTMAYLVGSLAEGVWRIPLQSRRLRVLTTNPASLADIGVVTRSTLWDAAAALAEARDLKRQQGMPPNASDEWYTGTMGNAVRSALGRRGATVFEEGKTLEQEEVEQRLEDAVIDELDQVRTDLLVKQPTVFTEFDRTRAESDLRLGLVLPLTLCSVTLAIVENPIWLVLLFAVGALAWDGVRRLRESRRVLVEALTTGRANAPALTRFKGAIRRAAPGVYTED